MSTPKDQPALPTDDIEELIKCTITVEIEKILPSIISTTVWKLLQNELANKTITMSKSNAVSTITGKESAASEANTNKHEESNNDKTTATASSTQ
eukprot:5369266-Ditylum_brightwellii.AAC.1